MTNVDPIPHKRDESRTDLWVAPLIFTACRDLGLLFGDAMKFLWAIGLFAAGQSSRMTGTCTGQVIMEGFMDIHISKWKRNLITRVLAMLPTAAIAVIYEHKQKIDEMNQILNVVQSIQLPFALIPLIHICCRGDIMGKRFVLQETGRFFVNALSAFVLALNLLLVVQQVHHESGYLKGAPMWVFLCLAVVAIAYVAFVTYLLVGPDFVWRVFEGHESSLARAIQMHFGRPQGHVFGSDSLDAVHIQGKPMHLSTSNVVQLGKGDQKSRHVTDSQVPLWRKGTDHQNVKEWLNPFTPSRTASKQLPTAKEFYRTEW
jgi:hypothetical protein